MVVFLVVRYWLENSRFPRASEVLAAFDDEETAVKWLINEQNEDKDNAVLKGTTLRYFPITVRSK